MGIWDGQADDGRGVEDDKPFQIMQIMTSEVFCRSWFVSVAYSDGGVPRYIFLVLFLVYCCGLEYEGVSGCYWHDVVDKS